jgi:hypothetical protein
MDALHHPTGRTSLPTPATPYRCAATPPLVGHLLVSRMHGGGMVGLQRGCVSRTCNSDTGVPEPVATSLGHGGCFFFFFSWGCGLGFGSLLGFRGGLVVCSAWCAARQSDDYFSSHHCVVMSLASMCASLLSTRGGWLCGPLLNVHQVHPSACPRLRLPPQRQQWRSPSTRPG